MVIRVALILLKTLFISFQKVCSAVFFKNLIFDWKQLGGYRNDKRIHCSLRKFLEHWIIILSSNCIELIFVKSIILWVPKYHCFSLEWMRWNHALSYRFTRDKSKVLIWQIRQGCLKNRIPYATHSGPKGKSAQLIGFDVRWSILNYIIL